MEGTPSFQKSASERSLASLEVCDIFRTSGDASSENNEIGRQTPTTPTLVPTPAQPPHELEGGVTNSPKQKTTVEHPAKRNQHLRKPKTMSKRLVHQDSFQSQTSTTMNDSFFRDDSLGESTNSLLGSSRRENLHRFPALEEVSHELTADPTNAAASNNKNNDNTLTTEAKTKRKKGPSDESSLEGRHVLRRIRVAAGKVVEHPYFQLFIIALIMINAAMMGLATMDFVTNNPDVLNAFEITDKVFLIIFTIELALNTLYHGLHMFTDGWLFFDGIIVISSWAFVQLQIVRAFRIFRALRLVSRLPALRRLVQAISMVLPRIAAISCLQTLIMYIYAVLCTTLFGDLSDTGVSDFDYFGTLDRSIFTLFQMMTLDWSQVARETQEIYPNSIYLFISFIILSGFIVYNMIIGVVCDSVSMLEQLRKSVDDQEEEPGQESVACDEKVIAKQMKKRLADMIEAQKQLLATAEGVVSEFENLR